jgi:DNA-binding IscR family transcriptional regulator
MSKISTKLRDLIKDDIISILYENPLKPLFTNQIAIELRRDNEFTLTLLKELEKAGYIQEVKKGKHGNYLARRKWKISNVYIKALNEKKH